MLPRRLRIRRLLLLLCVVLTGGGPAGAASDTTLVGRVRVDIPGISLSNLLPIVVYLTPAEARKTDAAKFPVARIRQKDARFIPGFLAVAMGQTVEMPNDDIIFHNVFSFSRPNEFDLGLYAAGNSKTIAFAHAGVVRIYCSIHENMNGTIFVSPSPHFATVDAAGRFEVRGLPVGNYRLETWSEKIPATARNIPIGPGRNEIGPIRLIEAID